MIQFVLELARERQMSGKQLAALAQRTVNSNDPEQVEKLNSEIARGVYDE